MCVPKKLGNVVGPQWKERPVVSHGYPYPKSLVLLLPSWVDGEKTRSLEVVETLSKGVLSVSLHREPGESRGIIGAFQIAFEPRGEKGDELGVTVAVPKKLAIFDGTGHWVPEVILPDRIFISVFLLDRRFNANWASDSPLIGLMFPGSQCPLAPWRVTIWRWLSYLGTVRGVS